MVQIATLRISGFRAFGADEQIFDLSPKLTIIWAPNSQGKTSVAEAIEFLLSGRISRRELVGSAAREFADSLENAHLQGDAGVSVSAKLATPTEVSHEVTRRLTADYSAQRECSSELTVDGTPVADLSAIGVRLSERPLETPILLQHNLRFVLSARPQDRTNYFKAILEIADLEVFRGLVAKAMSRASLPESHLVDQLESALSALDLPPKRELCDDDTSGAEKARRCLVVGLVSALDAGANLDLSELVQLAREELASRRERLFPLAALVSRGRLPETPDPSELLSVLETLRGVREEASTASEALLRLFDAYVSLVGVEAPGGGDAVDCPLCLTAGGLRPDRVTEITSIIVETREYRSALERARELQAELRSSVVRLGDGLSHAVPEIVMWDTAMRREKGVDEATLAVLLAEGGADLLTSWQGAEKELRGDLDSVRRSLARLEPELEELLPGECTEKDCDRLEAAFSALANGLGAVQASANQYSHLSGRLREVVVPILDERGDLRGLRDLVELSANTPLLGAQLEGRDRVESLSSEISGSLEEIDGAIVKVLDEKFDALAGEIARWWQLMRSEEPGFFAGVQRAGSGRRFIDLKAGLSSRLRSGESAAERHAVAVFSDSQLNCLGLSAFLARVARDPVGFVVLDDPIQGSDTEHRATFIEHVPSTLIKEGQQVILLTHDERLSRDLQERYAHEDLSVFSVLMEDPSRGALVEVTRDTVDVLLARVSPLRHREDVPSRKRAASILRDAAERFCKLVLVKHERDEGRMASLADFDGKTLGMLVPMVTPLLSADPAHAGKLRVVARHLNPGNHDDAAPPSGDIRHCRGELKRFCLDYL